MLRKVIVVETCATPYSFMQALVMVAISVGLLTCLTCGIDTGLCARKHTKAVASTRQRLHSLIFSDCCADAQMHNRELKHCELKLCEHVCRLEYER